jgi:hypothetical protein
MARVGAHEVVLNRKPVMRVRRPLVNNDPVESPHRLDIPLIGQHQLNWRTVFKFRVEWKGETQLTKPSLS